MALFLIDEDMHRSVAKVLEKLGHRVKDARDEGLRGQSDDDIFRFAQVHKAIILTADLDFSEKINAKLAKSLKGLTDQDFAGNLIIISLGRIRIRRAR